jgi:hypothetical protein
LYKDKLSEERIIKQNLKHESKSRVKSPVTFAVDAIFSRDRNKDKDQYKDSEEKQNQNNKSVSNNKEKKLSNNLINHDNSKNIKLNILTNKLNYKINGHSQLSDRLIVDK